MRPVTFIMLLFLLTSCHKNRVVNNAFYYWKTAYAVDKVEKQYFERLNCNKLYVRIMDVDNGDNGAVPISPILFKAPVPNAVQLIPVVFIVNNVLNNQTYQQLDNLAGKIVYYVNGKVKQSGKTSFNELQIDCDWTRTTRDNYFYLLQRIKANAAMQGKHLSATLRLHQLKNQKSNGIPPVNRVMLMCYNMGNLRKYGNQNSILEQTELEKYVGKNLRDYPIQVDVGLPLFSWAVVFRHKQYLGIAKRLNKDSFNDTRTYTAKGTGLYRLQKDEPQLGLKRGDEVRWENVSAAQLKAAVKHIEKYISRDTINIIYFHLDEQILKQYTYESLEEIAAVFR